MKDTKYYKTNVQGTEVKVNVYYSLGGMNYFNSKNEDRGYWISVSPIQIERRNDGIVFESYRAFSGTKRLIIGASRKSQSGFDKAFKLAEELENEMLNYISEKHGINIIK